MPHEPAASSWSRFIPFNKTLFGRISRDYAAITVLAMAMAVSWHWMFVSFLPKYNMRYQLAYIRKMASAFKAIMGPDIDSLAGLLSQTSIGAVAYVHPITLAILLGFAIMLPSGVLVGQIDRGTIELILSTQLSRFKLMVTTFLAGCVGGVFLILAMLFGTYLGLTFTKLEEPFHFDRIVICAVNLYAVYLLALAISTFLSSITRLRGYAVGWAVGLGLVAYLLHYLAEWWDWVQRISYLGPIYYYHPIKIATQPEFDPTRDIVLLCAVAAVFLAAAIACFSRRDIAVV